MLDWYWLDDICIFTFNGREVGKSNEKDFDRELEINLDKYGSDD